MTCLTNSAGAKRVVMAFLLSTLGAVCAIWLFFFTYGKFVAADPQCSGGWAGSEKEEIVADYYVSADGSDENDGTKESPFLTIKRAMAAVRETDKTDKKEIIVGVTEGTYLIDSLSFSGEDGGNADCQVRYVALGKVRITAGIDLDPGDFEPIENYPQIESRISKKARQKVKVVDLTDEKYGLSDADFDKIYPTGSYNTSGEYDEDETGPIYTQLYVNDETQTLARYPNSGYLYTEGVISSLNTKDADKNDESSGADAFLVSPELADRISGWESIEDVWMLGYWQYDWAANSTPIACFDEAKRVIEAKYHSLFGIKSEAPYYFFNCLEELDSDGEWYLDRDEGLLCLYTPDNMEDSEITLATSTAPLLNINCNYVSFEGFVFDGTRSSGIISHGNGIKIRECTIKNLAGTAIIASGYNNEFTKLHIYDIGSGGIHVSGGDTYTLAPSDNIVSNNLIHDWAKINRTYMAGISLSGVGNLCSNNELYDTPHLAISYSGNNNVVEYNLIHSVCLEANDAGAIYAGKSWVSYGNEVRYNCIYDLGKEGYTPSGIYMDDAISGQSIYGNLLVNIPGNSLFIGGGRDMKIYDNVIVNPGVNALHYDARARDASLGETWFTEDIHSLWHGLYASAWQSETWQRAYPEYSTVTDDLSSIDSPAYFANPANSDVYNNVIFNNNLSIGSVSDAVEQYSSVEKNKIYHISLLGFFFDDAKAGIYTFKVKNMPQIYLDKFGRY